MKLIKNKDGWKRVRLDDVVIRREENDRENARARFDTFVKVEHMEAGSLHLRELGSQKDEELPPTFYKIFREGQILFPTRNPHLRRTALAPCDGICGEKTLTLEVNEKVADPRLIPFLFHSASFYDHSAGAIIGSTNPHCRWRDIANFVFLLPPKVHQAKLAELLFAADQHVQETLHLIRALEAAKGAHLKAVFHDTKRTESLADQFEIVSGFPFKSKHFNEQGYGAKLMRGINIKEGVFEWNGQIDRYYDKEEGTDEKYVIKAGDILVPMDGSKLGWNVARATTREAGFLLVQRVARFRSSDENLSQLLLAFLCSPYFRSFIAQHNTTTAIPHISLKQLSGIKLPSISAGVANSLSGITQLTETIRLMNEKADRARGLKSTLINQII
jgi:type I restriction enzyme S subunit